MGFIQATGTFKAFSLVIPAATLAIVHHAFIGGAAAGNAHPYFALVASFIPDFYLMFAIQQHTVGSAPVVFSLLAAAIGEMVQIAASTPTDESITDSAATADDIIADLIKRRNRYGIHQSMSGTIDLVGWLLALAAHLWLAYGVYRRRDACSTRILAAFAVSLLLFVALDVFVRARVDGDPNTVLDLLIEHASVMLFSFAVLIRGPWRRKKKGD